MGLEFFWDGLFGGWRCVPPFSGLVGTSVHHGQARSFLGLVEGIEQVANGNPPPSFAACINQVKSLRLILIELEYRDGYKSADCPCAAATGPKD